MNLSGWRGKYIVRGDRYLTGAEESEDLFVCLLLCVMEKTADLSDFNRGQIVMARRLGTRVSKTAWLMGCLWSTVVWVLMQSRWMAMKPAVGDMVLDVHTLSKKKFVGDCPACWSRSQAVAHLIAQYNAESSRNVLEHTVLETVMQLCNRWHTHVPLLTNHHRQLCLCWEHWDWTMDQ